MLRSLKIRCSSFYSIFFLQANEYFNNFVGRNLARLCGFGEGWILHTGLDVGGLRVEWGVGPYSPSLVFLATARAQSCPRLQQRKNLYFSQRFIEGILHPISTLIEWYYRLREFFFYILGYANQTSLYKIAQVCTTYNRSKVWNQVGCNCQKFVLEVLNRFNLRFAPEAFIHRINQGDYDLTIADPEGLQPSSTASLNSMDSLRIIGTTCFHGQSTFYSLTTAYAQNELKITQEVMPVMQLPVRVLRYIPLTTRMRLIRSGGAA